MGKKKYIKTKNAHPGEIILKTITGLKMTQAELADRLGKTPSKTHDLLTGKEPITYTTALQLEKVLSIDAEDIMNLESSYRLELSRLEIQLRLNKEKKWLKSQPIKKLQQYGYLKSDDNTSSMVDEALEFYGVISTDKFNERYLDRYMKGALASKSVPQAVAKNLAAWLRIGELEMEKLKLPDYDKAGFKLIFEQIKTIIKEQPDNFGALLQQKCLSVGVAVIFISTLTKSSLTGISRWFRSNPMIQFSENHQTNDEFWRCFYHSCGHLIMHGKKEIFFEGLNALENDRKMEEEADRFAINQLTPEKYFEKLPEKITNKDIINIAKELETHPAIISLYLYKKGLISKEIARRHKVLINLPHKIWG